MSWLNLANSDISGSKGRSASGCCFLVTIRLTKNVDIDDSTMKGHEQYDTSVRTSIVLQLIFYTIAVTL